MIKRRIWDRLFSALGCMILAGELAVALDVVSVYYGRALSVAKFALLVMALFLPLLIAAWLRPGIGKKLRKTAAAVLIGSVGLVAAVFLCWNSISRNAVYRDLDEGKRLLYSDRKVMLLVPHQDDDINVLGGVMEEYVKYGSDVYVVFSTNGDYFDKADIRLQESVDVMSSIGIPKDRVIFLGYGDQWDPEGPHIYNGEAGRVLKSVVGYSETYGTAEIPAYRSGRAYTAENFREDVESVILEYRPDVLYCVDYDYNIDHRSLSMTFEKVMGKILKEYDDYRPQVFKGYAYNTAWDAVNDFCGENLLSTQDAFGPEMEPLPGIYRWAERVRLPVNGASLSRSVMSSSQTKLLAMYRSQGAILHAGRVINSDKVFWYRSTESLCLGAQVEVTSGNGSLLNDFMLLESNDLLNSGDMPYDGAWTPDGDDSQKQATVILDRPSDISGLVLYDHSDPQKNVADALITFDDGTTVQTGPLDPSGAATVIPVEKKNVSSFTVTLTQVQGDGGLAEIEAYGRSAEPDVSFVKLTDEDGNFAYDYWIEADGEQTFLLYTAGEASADRNGYSVSCTGDGCSAVLENGNVRVVCPKGKACVVTVADAQGIYTDTVYVRNPGSLERSWKMFWLRAEEAAMELCETKRLHERVFVFRLVQKLNAALR